MVYVLSAHVGKDPIKISRTHRGDTVSLRPFERWENGLAGRVDAMCGSTFHALQEAWDKCRRMQSNEHVEMAGDDANRQDASPLVSGDDGQVLPEEGCPTLVEAGGAGPGGPYNEDMNAMMHAPILALLMLGRGTNRCVVRRFSDISRAVASATSAR